MYRPFKEIAAAALAAIACGFAGPTGAGSSGSVPVPQAAGVIPVVGRLNTTPVSIGKFADPYGVGVDPRCASNCDVYVADPGARTVWLVKPDGTRTAIADPSSLGAAAFDPQSVAVSPADGAVVIADKENYHTESIVWKIANGSVSRIQGFNFDFGDPLQRMFARGIAVGPYGEVYVAMAQWGFLIDTGLGAECQGGGCPFSGLAATGTSYGIAVDESRIVYVAGTRKKILFRRVPGQGGFRPFLTVGDPYDVAVSWTGGHVVIADPANKRVWYVRPDGSMIDLGDFADPYGVAIDREGYVYVADAGSKDVWKIKLP